MGNGTGEAFIHVRAVEAAGHAALEPGTILIARIGPGPKGPQVAEIIRIDPAPATTVPPWRRPDEGLSPAPPFAPPLPRGNEERGAAPTATAPSNGSTRPRVSASSTVEGETKDLFVHISALERSGLSLLDPGQRVRVAVVNGRKGPEVGALELL